MHRKKIIGLSLASIMLLGSPAFGADLSGINSEMKAVPISAPVLLQAKAEVTTAEEIKLESEFVKYNVKIPKVQGLKDAVYQEQLNYILMSRAKEDIKNVETQAEELYKNIEKEGRVFRPFEIFIDFEMKSNDSILSFVVTTYSMTGGANGIIRVDTYNIDTEQSKQLDLKDLFKAGADYKAMINNEISQQIAVQREQEEKPYFEGDLAFKTISDYQNYYIKDNSLVILFQKYAIAPGYMGTPEFEIPLESLGGILQAEQKNEKAADIVNGSTEKGKDELDIDVSSMDIVVNNEIIQAPAAYMNDQGIVMVPLRAIGEALGLEAVWNDELRSVMLGKDISLKIGEDSYNYMNSAPIQLGTAPEIKDERTFVPLDFFKKVLLMNNAYVFEAQIVIDNGEKME